MSNKARPILVILFLSLLLAACGGGENDAATAVATEASAPAPATATATTESAPRPEPSVTPTVVVEPSATPPPVVDCTDMAEYVADITYPDGTLVAAGTTIVKTWRLRNVGTCTWHEGYHLVFADGAQMGAAVDSRPLTGAVAPGAVIDLNLSLVAPAEPGSYQGDWLLQNPAGGTFGIGENHDVAFWVQIEVTDGAGAPAGGLSGYVWQDLDNDGTLDAGETLAGITVSLTAGADCGAAVAEIESDAAGSFTFGNLEGGTYCLSGSDGETTVSQGGLALAAGERLSDVNLTWPPQFPQPTVFSGIVYQDSNGNGIYDEGEPLVADREVWLLPGPACQVLQDPISLTYSLADGKYILGGEYSGSYCLGLPGPEGLDYVVSVTVNDGQMMDDINLIAP